MVVEYISPCNLEHSCRWVTASDTSKIELAALGLYSIGAASTLPWHGSKPQAFILFFPLYISELLTHFIWQAENVPDGFSYKFLPVKDS